MIELILGFIGALAGSFISFIIFRRQNWGEVISKSRMGWINDFRDEISIILLASELRSPKEQEIFEIIKSKNRLLTKLNVRQGQKQYENQRLTDLVEVVTIKNMNLSSEWRAEVLSLTKEILENEWQRVKKEAKGVDME